MLVRMIEFLAGEPVRRFSMRDLEPGAPAANATQALMRASSVYLRACGWRARDDKGRLSRRRLRQPSSTRA